MTCLAAERAVTPYHGTDVPVFEALAEALVAAEAYAGAGANLASVHDRRGAEHSIRQAAACIMAAADLLQELRPAERPGPGERRR